MTRRYLYKRKRQNKIHAVYADLKKAKISLGDAIKKLAALKSGKMKKKHYRYR